MKRVLIFNIIIMSVISGCSIYKSLEDISKLQFKIDSISDFYVNGVSISEKTKLAEFSSSDILKLSMAFMNRDLPAKFNVNVEVKNPNYNPDIEDGTTITIKSFPWELFIDNQKIISGDISRPIVIPGNIQNKILPVNIKLNLIELFQGQGMNELVELILAFSGDSNSTSRIELFARPVLDTSLGEITYPNKLKIVDYTYN